MQKMIREKGGEDWHFIGTVKQTKEMDTKKDLDI